MLLTACGQSRELVYRAKGDSTYSHNQADSTHAVRVVFLPDSAYIEALLECDSLGHVYIAKIEQLQSGKRIKPEVIIKNNYLKASCKVDSMLVYELIASRYKVSEKVENKMSIEEIKPPDKPRFRLFDILPWVGYIPMFLTVVYIIYRLIKLFRL